MTPSFSLAHLTVLSLSPPEVIRVASRTGYRGVGLRLIAVTPETPGYPLMDDRPLMRETKNALAETGQRVGEIEFVKITPEIDIAALEPFVAAGAELGAKYVIAAPYDPDLDRLSDRLGALADLSGRHGLGVVLEFFPWTVVAGFMAAVKVVAAAHRGNLGVLVDTLHFDRCGDKLADLSKVSAELLPFVHVCDAPAGKPSNIDAMLHTARAERLPPGEGAIDITGILRHLPPAIQMSLEVPMDDLTSRIGAEAVALRVRQAADRLLSGEAR